MGMRCKKHPFQAGGGGVCATCLRDRLLVLAAERNGASSPPARAQAQAPPAPEPAAFPRSVSPYVSRSKSDAAGGGGEAGAARLRLESGGGRRGCRRRRRRSSSHGARRPPGRRGRSRHRGSRRWARGRRACLVSGGKWQPV